MNGQFFSGSARLLTAAVSIGFLVGGCGGGNGVETQPTPQATATVAQPTPVTPKATEIPTQISPNLSSFEGVCVGGTVAAAPPYDGSSPGPHPVLAFVGTAAEYEWKPLNFPEGWTVQFPQISSVQLVACLDRTRVELAKSCTGYRAEGVDHTLELYDATYDVKLYAAQTGTEIASTTLTVKSGDCPMLTFFNEDELVKRDYADPNDQLRSFVAPYVAP